MKKVISLLLLLTMLLPLCLTVFADEAEPAPVYEVSDSTSIAQDFEIAFGGKYKLEDFPYDETVGGSEEDNDDIFLIDVIEKNYSDKSKYQLYLYVYNPTRKQIDFESESNKVSLLSNVTGGRRKSHELQLVAQEGDGLLFKFKIADLKENLISQIKDRFYDISELELLTADSQEGEATAYAVAMKYTFRENALGFLVQQLTETEVVQTKVQHSYYRYQSDEYNEYCDLRSVYFNVPNEIIEEYGPMEAIRAEWEECQLYPIVVTNNQQVQKVFEKNVLSSRLKSDMVFFWDYLYNINNVSHWSGAFANIDVEGNNTNYAHSWSKYLGGAFYRKNIDEPEKVVIPAAELKTYIDTHYGWKDYAFKSIDRSNFGDNVNWFDVHTTLELDKYIVPETNVGLWIHKAFRTELEKNGEDVETFTSLRKVNAADLDLSAEEFSKKYKVAVEDFENIKSAQESEKTMYILSYTVTDYKVCGDDIYYRTAPEIRELESKYDTEHNEFVAEVVAIRNFDLIEAKYTKEGVTTVIPFVASRTNAVPGITTPNVPKGSCEDIIQLVYTIIMALILVIVLVLIIRVVNYFKRKRREKYIDNKIKQEKG